MFTKAPSKSKSKLWPGTTSSPNSTRKRSSRSTLPSARARAPVVEIERLKTMLDIERLKTVLGSCEMTHGPLCNPTKWKTPQGLILVDVVNMCLVSTPPMSIAVRYVALSYVWGPTLQGREPLKLTLGNFAQLQKPGSFRNSNLPETIRDAIELCNRLGENYLWVDRLCIVQDDPATKHLHIRTMAVIYGSAIFTIVAATGKDDTSGLPRLRVSSNIYEFENSVFENEHSSLGMGFAVDVGKSVWNERAWTYQEYLLSRRCIFFTGHQVYFQCQQGLWCETCNENYPVQNLVPDESHLLNTRVPALEKYRRAVMEYNTRKITYSSDILDAFLGVGTLLADQMGTSLLHALPESYFQWALLWQHSGSFRWRKGSGHPSWSWLAWEGQISFPRYQQFSGMVHFYYNNPDLGLISLRTAGSYSSGSLSEQNNLQHSLPAGSQAPPYSLIFTTTTAQLQLSANDLHGSLFTVNIRDLAGVTAGYLWLGQTVEEMESLCKERLYEIALIATSAGLKEGTGRTQMHIMLIQRMDSSVLEASRIGIGWIYKYRWDQMQQTSQTLVLV